MLFSEESIEGRAFLKRSLWRSRLQQSFVALIVAEHSCQRWYIPQTATLKILCQVTLSVEALSIVR